MIQTECCRTRNTHTHTEGESEGEKTQRRHKRKKKKNQDASVGAVIRTDNGLEKNKKKKSATEVEPNVYRKFI